MKLTPWSLVDPETRVRDLAPCGLVVFDERRHRLVVVRREHGSGYVMKLGGLHFFKDLDDLDGAERIGELAARWSMFEQPRFLLVPRVTTPRFRPVSCLGIMAACFLSFVVVVRWVTEVKLAELGVVLTLAIPIAALVWWTRPRLVGERRLGVDASNIHAYALAVARGELWRGALPAASVVAPGLQVQRIREEYGRLRSDLLFRLESPALFDPAVPTTAAFEAALVEFSETPTAEVAARVEVRFEVARQHAVRVGLRHVEPGLRDEVARAGKVARLALGAGSVGEREAALVQLQRILDSLALYYLPSRAQLRELLP
ncbi:hypothetical protein [Arachnia propionica]|uniref:Uncharacterized protein n=1 Tax=Arachnia propionica TaxID=1750 RepID=A0A3P1WRX4_9ACTN|nr:hypothetical protein [Arachnia propionica]RRD48517.1 hypothetical protein EII35_12335 [Arachnia propionica]